MWFICSCSHHHVLALTCHWMVSVCPRIVCLKVQELTLCSTLDVCTMITSVQCLLFLLFLFNTLVHISVMMPVFAPAVHLQPCLWRLSSSGACPAPRSWPAVCYHANNTSPCSNPSVTKPPRDSPRVIGRAISTREVTIQPHCSAATFSHPHRSTLFWRPTSTASRFVASFVETKETSLQLDIQVFILYLYVVVVGARVWWQECVICDGFWEQSAASKRTNRRSAKCSDMPADKRNAAGRVWWPCWLCLRTGKKKVKFS